MNAPSSAAAPAALVEDSEDMEIEEILGVNANADAHGVDANDPNDHNFDYVLEKIVNEIIDERDNGNNKVLEENDQVNADEPIVDLVEDEIVDVEFVDHEITN